MAMKPGHPSSSAADPGPRVLASSLRAVLRLSRPARKLADSPKRIHQLRIATRRAQCAALILEPRLTPALASTLTDPLRKLRRAAGRARDTHIRIKLIKRELAPLDKPARRIIARLASRHEDDLDRLRRAAKRRREQLAEALEAARRRLAAPGPSFGILAARATQMIRAEAAALIAGDLDDPARLHRLRRTLKRLRYTIELAGPGHAAGPGPQRSSAAQLKALARLQDTLGEWNDLRLTLDSVPTLDPGEKPTPARRRLQRRTAAAQARAIRAVRAWHAKPRMAKARAPLTAEPGPGLPAPGRTAGGNEELGDASSDEFRLTLATPQPEDGTPMTSGR